MKYLLWCIISAGAELAFFGPKDGVAASARSVLRGFLIIPALVLLAKLPMKKAVATSLMIISAKSLIGFIGDVENFDIDWLFLLIFSSLSILGIYIGTFLNQFIEGRKLKKSFGWFVMLMAIYILIMELL